MLALRQRGIDLPEPLGRDREGRLTLRFVPGVPAIDDEPLGDELLHRIGALVRSIHDASEGLPVPSPWEVLLPARRPDLVCHNDLGSWNLIIDGDRLVFIDWDGAGPSTRIWDLAYAAVSFGHLFPCDDPGSAGRRLAAFVDGYQPVARLRTALPRAMASRASARHGVLRRSDEAGDEPWASMYADGHGEHWAGTADFISHHEQVWRRALRG